MFPESGKMLGKGFLTFTENKNAMNSYLQLILEKQKKPALNEILLFK